MSWIERMLEEHLADAAARGELDGGPLQGRPIADLDRQRPQGWWADRFVQRERSHDRRETAEAAARAARAGFWRCESSDELLASVREANEAIVHANINLIDQHRLVPFDPVDIEMRWRSLRTTQRG